MLAEVGMTDRDISAEAVFQPGLFDQLAVGLAELDPDRRWLRVNQHLCTMLGNAADNLPATLDDLTHPEDKDVEAIHLELLASGAADRYRQELRLRRGDGSFLWVDASVRAVRHADGSLARWTLAASDISRYKDAEQRAQTVLAELAHRGRNLFSILQSLARRSLTGDRSLNEANTVFQGRLSALAESLTALMEQDFAGHRLDLLLRQELHSLGARATVQGPPLMLTAGAAQTFSLVVHELATNATKYGALSTVDGRLSVAWTVTGAGPAARCGFEWRETGGPPAAPPSRRGFGTTLITDIAGAEFDCKPRTNYAESGFDYGFEAPLARMGALVVESPVRRKLRHPVLRALYDGWALEKDPASGLSSFARFDWSRFAATGVMTVARVQPDGSVRLVRVGRALVERLGRPLSKEELELHDLNGTREAYLRCVRRQAPCHEQLRFGFGTGEPVDFERLLVPFSDVPDGPVAYIIGMAVFSGSTADPDGAGEVRHDTTLPVADFNFKRTSMGAP
jgi:PAS domain S-box-containing protein